MGTPSLPFHWRIKFKFWPGVFSWRKLRATCALPRWACASLGNMFAHSWKCYTGVLCARHHTGCHIIMLLLLLFNLSFCHVVSEALGRVGLCVFMFDHLFNLSFGPGGSSEGGWRPLYFGFRGDFLFFIPFLELMRKVAQVWTHTPLRDGMGNGRKS